MARYIDLDKYIERLNSAEISEKAKDDKFLYEQGYLSGLIQASITAKAMPSVEIVRCKDCQYFTPSKVTNSAYCDWHREYYETYPNDFCCYGIRRQ